MRCSGFPLEDYGFYTLGSLTGPELEEIDEHLTAGCETCLEAVSASNVLWYSVARATPDRKPPHSLRSKVVNSVPGFSPWWARPFPAFVLAGCLTLMALVIGGALGSRWFRPPVIVFSPAPAKLPPVAAVAPESRELPPLSAPTAQVITKEVVSPAQTAAIEALKLDLARERQKTGELEADLNRQRALVASASRPLNTVPPALADRGAAEAQLQRTVEAVEARADELERQVAQYRLLLASQSQRADRNLQLVSMMSDPAIRLVRMRGTEKDAGVEGHALIASSSRMVFFASRLPPLPADRTYQLWLMRTSGNGVVSAGLFRPDSSHQAIVTVNNPALLANATALAVTDEPAQGSPLPTGHKWMIGS